MRENNVPCLAQANRVIVYFETKKKRSYFITELGISSAQFAKVDCLILRRKCSVDFACRHFCIANVFPCHLFTRKNKIRLSKAYAKRNSWKPALPGPKKCPSITTQHEIQIRPIFSSISCLVINGLKIWGPPNPFTFPSKHTHTHTHTTHLHEGAWSVRPWHEAEVHPAHYHEGAWSVRPWHEAEIRWEKSIPPLCTVMVLWFFSLNSKTHLTLNCQDHLNYFSFMIWSGFEGGLSFYWRNSINTWQDL